MKEIKFRAWDKNKNRMVDVSSLAHDGSIKYSFKDETKEYKVGYMGGGQYVNGDLKSEEIHLMQYTGTTDKNDVPIYEGDIVKTRVMHDYDSYSEDYFIEVIFENCGFKPMIEKKKTQYRVLPLYFDFEVVGNIYENPEINLTK